MADKAPFVMVSAGGTGGHLFPAEALAHALARRGVAVELATDERAAKYADRFPARAVHSLPAATPSGGGILRKALALLTLGRGYLRARRLIRVSRPAAVVGFGGYPTVPPLAAASALGVPTVLHEQNAVLGRANRFLSTRVTVVATGFDRVGGLEGHLSQKARHVGNPVRPAVVEASGIAYDAPRAGGGFRLLVFGGSQGARVMSDIVPSALERLPAEERARLFVVQQARDEDLARVREAYARLGVQAIVEPFFKDLPFQIANAHLVVARAGASTVAELAVIGRPSILVPLPHALDQDQAANAASLARDGGAIVRRQDGFTPDWLADTLSGYLANPAPLADAALAARAQGIPDAAERLADLVCEVAGLSASVISLSPERRA